jgi:hypothetical protein
MTELLEAIKMAVKGEFPLVRVQLMDTTSTFAR